MTRFMMSLEDSVDLVEYAFNKGTSGDIFIKKSPAATVKTLAEALKEIFNSNSEIKFIGTRHSEKLYETLLSNEEMQRAQDLGDYFRISTDSRDLNYAQYVSEGFLPEAEKEEYNSHNTTQLDIQEMIKLLKNLDYIQQELK